MTFSVQLSSQTTFNNNQKVIFDNVISNVGNGYNNVTGIFTVPHNGSYELTLTNMRTLGRIFTNIMRNGQWMCVARTERMPMIKVRGVGGANVEWFK